MSGKAKASKERDAMKAQLTAMMSSTTAPGAEQAGRTAKIQPDPPKSSPKAKSAPAPKKKAAPVKAAKKAPAASKPKAVTKIPKPATTRRGGEEKAEKVSVSLHPTDQDNAELIEDALREAGLITRRAPISFLLKVALASFDPEKTEDLPGIVETIKAKDGRGRWAQEMSAKNVK